MNLPTLTIDQLATGTGSATPPAEASMVAGLRPGHRPKDTPRSRTYKNHLFITERVQDVERLRTPCRIRAVTVLICLGGSLHCTINLLGHRVAQDMMLVVFPEDVIQITQIDRLQAYALLISPDLLTELNIDHRERSLFYLDVHTRPVCPLPRSRILPLRPYYQLLATAIDDARAETPEIITALVQAFSYTVISLMREHAPARDADSADADGRADTHSGILFRRFMALVRQHHTRARGVKYYADRMCLTPNYLSGVVKHYTGKTAAEWVNEYVILEAKLMLKDTTLSIQEISYRLNFATQSAFGKYFKQQTGVSPKAYRRGTGQ